MRKPINLIMKNTNLKNKFNACKVKNKIQKINLINKKMKKKVYFLS